MRILYELDYSHEHGNKALLRGWVIMPNGKRKEAIRYISRFCEHSGEQERKEEIAKELLND